VEFLVLLYFRAKRRPQLDGRREMRWLVTCAVVCGGVFGSVCHGAVYVVTGPAIDVPGYSPQFSYDEVFSDISSDGQYMLLLKDHSPDYKVAARTRNSATGEWDPTVVLFSGDASSPSLGPDRALHDGTTLFYNHHYDFMRSTYSSGSWSPAVNVFDAASLVGGGPVFTGSQLYFNGNDFSGQDVQIWVADYDPVNDTFGTPALVNLGGDGQTSTPWVSRDGRQMIFISDRSGGYGGYDLYSATWDGTAWGHVTNLGPNVNTSSDEYGGRIAEDAGLLMFTRGYPWEIMQAPVSTPEPSTLIIWSLLGGVGIGIGQWRRRRTA
jgi:hypothetical protein